MNVKQNEAKNPKDNIFQARFRAKELVEHEKEEKEKQSQKVISFFKGAKNRDLFENEATIVKNYNKHIGPAVDFSYFKLNLAFLKKFKISLQKISSDLATSSSCKKIVYSEYYLDKQNSCIILVKYHFKHVRIYSDNDSTDLFTYSFINTRSEIFYYDEYLGSVLVKKYTTNMNSSHAKELLKSKCFKVGPSAERTYKLFSRDAWEEKSVADIHLIPKELLDILLAYHKNDSVPSNSEIQIDTKFLGPSVPTLVQYNVEVNYKYSGTVQSTECLMEYEIILYFKNIPETKVKAHFYLTEAEKSKELVLSDELLGKITLESVKENLEKKSNYCKHFYSKYLLYKEETKKKSPSLVKLAEMIYQSTRIEDSFVEYSQLANSYKGIYLEHFVFNSEDTKDYLPFCEQIRESKLEYDGKHFSQSAMYAVLYDQLYLVKLSAEYISYRFTNSSVILYFPAFAIKEINIEVFKPLSSSEIDAFVENKELPRKSCEFSSYNYTESIRRNRYLGRNDWNKIFPNFVVQTKGERQSYSVVEVSSNAILAKVLDCITNLRSETSPFHFSTYYPFGYDDDEEPKTRIPLISDDGIEYGYYFDDGFNKVSVNSPLKGNCNYSYSSGDELFSVIFDSNEPYYRTTFYNLLESYNVFNRSTEIKDTQYQSFKKYSFWDICIKHLIHIQN